MAKQTQSPGGSTKYPERVDNPNVFWEWLGEFFGQFKLAWRLLLDGRVPVLAKLIPFLTALYVLFPVDIVPDLALGFGQLDDLAFFLIGLRLFIDVCPPDLVQAYERQYKVDGVWSTPEGKIIDLEAHPVSRKPDVEGDGKATG